MLSRSSFSSLCRILFVRRLPRSSSISLSLSLHFSLRIFLGCVTRKFCWQSFDCSQRSEDGQHFVIARLRRTSLYTRWRSLYIVIALTQPVRPSNRHFVTSFPFIPDTIYRPFATVVSLHFQTATRLSRRVVDLFSPPLAPLRIPRVSRRLSFGYIGNVAMSSELTDPTTTNANTVTAA